MSISLDNWETQMRRGWLEVAILATLWQGRLYGLEIIRALETGSDFVVAEGTVYPLLARLFKAGLVEAEWVESDSGHPRKYYRLTAAGRRTTLTFARSSRDLLQKMLALVEPLLKENRR
jgi:PadR family transcriptional regulator PadR